MTFWPRLEVSKRDIQFIVDTLYKGPARYGRDAIYRVSTNRVLRLVGKGRGGGWKGDMRN